MVQNKLFVDSNYWVGLYSHADTLKAQIHQITQDLLKEQVKFFISNYVFAEVITVLELRSSHQIAMKFAEDVLNPEKLITIITSTSEDDEAVVKLLKKLKTGKTSFTDASNLILMQKQGISNLLTFDQGLSKVAKSLGFKVRSD